jgi:glutathione S-transferase
MSEFKLYCFGESGNSYKVALMLNLCGASWEPVWVDYFNGETRSPAYRGRINAMGEAPVLEHRGRMLSQSGVILQYLADETGKFGGRNADERLEILRWTLFDNHKFTSYLATLRYMLFLAKTGETPVTEFLRGRMTAAFKIADAHLAGSSYVAAQHPTIADISMCGYLFYEHERPFDLKEYPNIARWMDRMRALPGWKAPYDLMPRSKGPI